MAETRQGPRRGARRVAIAVGSALVVLVVLLSVALVLVDQEAVARRVVDRVLPVASERLGREVTVEGARAKLLPPTVTLTGLKVLGVGNEPPLVETAEAEAELALWPLIRSLGKEVEVTSVRLVRPELNLLRGKGGEWNFEGLGAQKQPPSEREVLVSKVELEDGIVRVIDRSTSHGEATVALTDLDATAHNQGVGRPFTVQARAAFASAAQNVKLELTASELPQKLEGLASDAWPELTGTLSIEGGQLAQLEGFLPARVGKLVTGGAFGLDAALKTVPGRQYVLEGDAKLDGVRLRGEPANGSAHVVARVDPANLGAPEVRLEPLALQGPGIDLAGFAALRGKPAQVAFAFKGKRLELNTLLGVLPEEEAAPQQRAALLPAQLRKAIEDVSATGTLQIAEVVSGKLTATALDAEATLRRGVLTLEKGKAELYAGKVDVRGSTVDLTRPQPQWNLRARLEQVDLAQAMSAISGAAPLEGRADAALTLTGEGAQWAEVQKNVTGRGTLAILEGALTTTDLGQQVAGALSKGLRALGRKGAASTVEQAAGRTPLKDLRGTFAVKDGWLALREPLGFRSSMGAVAVDGRIGLDQQLDLQGTVRLSEEFLARVAPGSVRPSGGADVPVGFGGTLRSPQVKTPEPTALARQLVEGELQKRSGPLKEEVKRQARRRLGGFLDRLGGGN